MVITIKYLNISNAKQKTNKTKTEKNLLIPLSSYQSHGMKKEYTHENNGMGPFYGSLLSVYIKKTYSTQ